MRTMLNFLIIYLLFIRSTKREEEEKRGDGSIGAFLYIQFISSAYFYKAKH